MVRTVSAAIAYEVRGPVEHNYQELRALSAHAQTARHKGHKVDVAIVWALYIRRPDAGYEERPPAWLPREVEERALANGRVLVWHSHEDLAWLTGRSVSTVERQLRKAVASGIVQKHACPLHLQQQQHTTHVYEVERQTLQLERVRKGGTRNGALPGQLRFPPCPPPPPVALEAPSVGVLALVAPPDDGPELVWLDAADLDEETTVVPPAPPEAPPTVTPAPPVLPPALPARRTEAPRETSERLPAACGAKIPTQEDRDFPQKVSGVLASTPHADAGMRPRAGAPSNVQGAQTRTQTQTAPRGNQTPNRTQTRTPIQKAPSPPQGFYPMAGVYFGGTREQWEAAQEAREAQRAAQARWAALSTDEKRAQIQAKHDAAEPGSWMAKHYAKELADHDTRNTLATPTRHTE